MMTCVKTDKSYIGVTVVRNGNVEKSLQIRMTQHMHRAFIAESDRILPTVMRKYSEWTIEKIDVVRGKAEAFAMEAIIINESGLGYYNMTKKG